MPLYDYRCPSCSAQFELLVRASDQPACPKCGATGLEKLVSRVSPPGKSKAIIQAGRERARREGHLSNF